MELNPSVFKDYVKKAADLYLRSAEEKEALLNQTIWNSEEKIVTESVSTGGDIPGDAVLFSVDGVDWTMDAYEAELKRHPLVFRQRKMSNQEFPEQLKLAIADLVRDHFLTKTAYELGYDRIPNIQQLTHLWQDHYVSRQARNDYITLRMTADGDTLNDTETELLQKYMDPLVNSLQAKYSEQIQINTELFESLKLSSVPMMVSSRNQPFPLAVPSFPRLTTDDRVDYGQRLEN